jgi:hypothetical protein
MFAKKRYNYGYKKSKLVCVQRFVPDLCTSLPPRRKMASRKIYIRLDQNVEQVLQGNCQMHISSVDKK